LDLSFILSRDHGPGGGGGGRGGRGGGGLGLGGWAALTDLHIADLHVETHYHQRLGPLAASERVDVLDALRQRHFKPALAAILSTEHLAIARRDIAASPCRSAARVPLATMSIVRVCALALDCCPLITARGVGLQRREA
jgi:hypothetical protein